MAEKISDEMIEYMTVLAQIELSGQEKSRAKKDMEEILAYMDKLKELDTKNAEPVSHMFPVYNVFREDIVLNEDGSKDTLLNAPCQKDNGFCVPKTIAPRQKGK